MTGAAPTPFRAKPIDRISRLLGTTLIFILAGPPIGSLVYIAIGLDALVKGVGKFELAGVLTFVGLSYLPGLLPAAVSGFTVGLVQSITGRAPWWIVPIASYFGASVYQWGAALRSLQIPLVSSHFFASCLIATVGCVLIARWLERAWWRPTDAPVAREGAERET
jgi:hypothetical protein